MYRYYTNLLVLNANSSFFNNPVFNIDKLNVSGIDKKILFNLSKLAKRKSFIDTGDYFFNVFHLSKTIRIISSPFHSYISISGNGRTLKEIFIELKRWLKKVGYKFKEKDFIKNISYIEVYKDIPNYLKSFVNLEYSYIWFGKPKNRQKIKNTEYKGRRGHKQKVKYQRPKKKNKDKNNSRCRVELRLWKCKNQNAKVFYIILILLGYFISLIEIPGYFLIKSFEMLDITCLYNKSPPFLLFSVYKCG